MASGKGIECQIITPERTYFDSTAESVTLPAHDGEIGLLPKHAPLLCKLGIGILRLQAEGKTERFFVDGGFAQIQEDKLVVLTGRSSRPEEIDVAATEAALSSARNRKARTTREQEERSAEIARAEMRLKLAKS